MPDILTFIGRFRPFTKAHEHIVQQAIAQSKKTIVIVGSCGAPRDPRNPFNFSEVLGMISSVFQPELDSGALVVAEMHDFLYDDPAWLREVHRIVASNTNPGESVGLIGHAKDNTSYYTKKFPMWGTVDVSNFRGINATDVRRAYFMVSDWEGRVRDSLSDPVIHFLRQFQQTEDYKELQFQYKHIADYPAIWGKGPHLTSDSVCLQAGNILLIERGGEYGRGQLALPGGFIHNDETLLQAAVRELKEETRIDMPAGAIEGSFVKAETFDNPHRDLRARIVTTAHLFDMNSEIDRQVNRGGNVNLTRVKGADDAKKAMWVPLGSVTRERMFLDHYYVIQKMLSFSGKAS